MNFYHGAINNFDFITPRFTNTVAGPIFNYDGFIFHGGIRSYFFDVLYNLSFHQLSSISRAQVRDLVKDNNNIHPAKMQVDSSLLLLAIMRVTTFIQDKKNQNQNSFFLFLNICSPHLARIKNININAHYIIIIFQKPR